MTLTATWVYIIKKQKYKPRGHVSNLEYGRHLTQLRRRDRFRTHASTSNTTSHDNYEKIRSWVSFSFLYGYGAPLGRLALKGQMNQNLDFFLQPFENYEMLCGNFSF